MKILVLGANGMLGSAVFRVLATDGFHDVWGTVRSLASVSRFPAQYRHRLITGVDVLDADGLVLALGRIRPEVVINAVGLIKQLADANDPLVALPINALLPHRLARLCALVGARLVHVSSDCVYSGRQGRYKESDRSDAEDLYGRSKYLGELHDLDHAITLRTSIIGHEQASSHALIDWFLSQEGRVRGFSRAVFSGLPTVELARVIKSHVLPRPNLTGLYHVSAEPIDKCRLLTLVARQYQKSIEIVPDDSVVIDRSLDGKRFAAATGYSAPDWPDLVRLMYEQRGWPRV